MGLLEIKQVMIIKITELMMFFVAMLDDIACLCDMLNYYVFRWFVFKIEVDVNMSINNNITEII